MAETICIIGNKGGTGKTTLSHMLAHGLGLLGLRVVAVLTDTTREPLAKAGRNYLPIDARSPEALARLAAKLSAIDGWFGVLDGGGNRPDTDRELVKIADLVLLPFRDSHEDIRALRQDLERFPNAYLLPSQWPTNSWQQQASEKTINQLLSDYRERILEPMFTLSSSKMLLQKELPEILPTPLNNACRKLAWQVLELLGIELVREPLREQTKVATRDHREPELAMA